MESPWAGVLLSLPTAVEVPSSCWTALPVFLAFLGGVGSSSEELREIGCEEEEGPFSFSNFLLAAINSLT